MMFSRRPIGWAFSCALIAALLLSTTSNADTIASKGAGHNGVFLYATKTPAAGQGIIITLEIECRKNWGGKSAGATFVQIVGVGTTTPRYEQLAMTCEANGGVDGATKTSKTANGVFLQGAQNAVIIATMEHQDRSNWDVWQSSIENTVKARIDQLVDTITDPQQLIQAATGAGLISAFL